MSKSAVSSLPTIAALGALSTAVCSLNGSPVAHRFLMNGTIMRRRRREPMHGGKVRLCDAAGTSLYGI